MNTYFLFLRQDNDTSAVTAALNTNCQNAEIDTAVCYQRFLSMPIFMETDFIALTTTDN